MAAHDIAAATINYGRPIDGRIWYDAVTGKTNLEYVPAEHTVLDARPHLAQLNMEKEGFVYLNQHSRVADYDNEAEVKSTCYQEAVELAKRATGAKSAVVFDHTLRRIAPRDGAFARGSVSFVHLDYTDDSAPKRLRDFFGATADKVGRWGIVNVWRPINVPYVVDVPLAMIDASSCPRSDLLAYDIVYPDRVGGNYVIKNNPEHRIYYLHHQTPDEALVFKQYDSDASKVQYAPHAAFDNPNASKEPFKPRESIELRLFVFYEDELPNVTEKAKL